MSAHSITMKFIAASAVSTALLSLFSLEIKAQTAPEASLPERIEVSAQRIAPLRAKQQTTEQRYALEKAQCWLDFAKHEALRNNPSAMPELAQQKAQQLISALESGTPLNAQMLDSSLTQTPIERMRKDLWVQLDALKSSQQLPCAAKAVACGEVMLVQAAHAHERIDWRYAQPYFGMAQDLVLTASKQAAVCSVKP